MAEAKLFKARQEPLLLLAAKQPEHEIRGSAAAAPPHHGENQAGEISMIKSSDAAPSLPLRPLRLIFSITHVASRRFYGVGRPIRQRYGPFHRNFMTNAVNVQGFSALSGDTQGALMR